MDVFPMHFEFLRREVVASTIPKWSFYMMPVVEKWREYCKDI